MNDLQEPTFFFMGKKTWLLGFSIGFSHRVSLKEIHCRLSLGPWICPSGCHAEMSEGWDDLGLETAG
jgi:hypothetical protein